MRPMQIARPMFIGYRSAMEYLRNERYENGSPFYGDGYFINQPAQPPSERTCRVHSLPTRCPIDDDVRETLRTRLSCLTTPVHVLVSSRGGRWATGSLSAHLLTSPVPTGSFRQLDDKLYLASPELCLVQMRQELTDIELIRLAMELCGTYALAPQGWSSPCKCPPATSLRYIEKYCKRAAAAGLRGACAAWGVLRHAADGCASPMEAAVTMLLCLPCRMGGYGVPMPMHNIAPGTSAPRARSMRAWMDKPARNGGGHPCDLFWPARGVALEYDGERGHSGAGREAADSVRDNELAALGCTLVKVKKGQLYDVGAFDMVARQVRSLLGLGTRLHNPECRYGWKARRAELREALLFSD